ncbi:o-succinylbenzoate synthase [Iningainema tapete]|uniref:o-succinylbenzoate synthase n=1 Tax=Iningainema tapete BLCC-T55 TaxID=2748662 RepID=A0A8J6XWT4_9CYAN|nr:o-succinylbenzoate synthase [Iningainema tapete]MBD2774748.1 o-succinylbenzoate synthase [Iningainema tapete BLCC-T55]
MRYLFEFRPYRRRFVRALSTSYGSWEFRDGIIVRLVDEAQRVGWGEIAPISWFGSESLEEALDFCCGLGGVVTEEAIFSIPDELSACQFGFEVAWEDMNREDAKSAKEEGFTLSYCGLLPAGEAVLRVWKELWRSGCRTFKWKIGVYGVQEELAIFELLVQAMPDGAKLRLDANGGLCFEEANLWLWSCDSLRASLEIEFLEQPLSVEYFDEMLELSCCYATAIALDESVSTLKQLVACYERGWRGVFVIKPGIVGSPSRLRRFCQHYQIDAVFSSVFETAIGRQAALGLAVELSQHNRAVGFGVNYFFDREEETWLENLWKDV